MNIIDRVEELKYNTLTNIENIQKAKIPIIYELKLERRYSFNTHGFYHSAYDETWLLYVCRNLPFTPNQTRHVYADSLTNMVNNSEMRPFLLFIDNRFVKWSDIEIINDCKFSYILIKNNPNLMNPKCQCILLPDTITYRENSSNINDNTIFAFDDYGNCSYNPQYNNYTIIDSTDKNLFHSVSLLEEGGKQLSDIDTKYKITKSNFIIFKNGLLDTSVNLVLHGLNVYSVNNNILRGSQYMSKQFYYLDSNLSQDNITNPYNKEAIIQRLQRSNIPEYVLQLANSFDFTFDKNLSYEENIDKAFIYIMTYNSSLMNEIYKESSNLESRIYKGKDLKLLMNERGYITMSRRLNSIHDNYPIIFHNGELYKYYNETTYKNKSFTFPLVNVSDSDIIEILFFKKIDNRVFPLYLPSGDNDIQILDSSIDINHMKLYTINPENSRFNIERTERTQYEVPFVVERLNNDTVDIKLQDSFHYDRRLSLVSDRQFRYMCKIVQQDTIDVILSKDFNFCTERNKYMVFINGRKIDNENFTITIAKDTLPFDDLSVYVNIPLSKGDKIEIFYVSEPLEEITVQPRINQSGIVTVNRDKISYDLDEELYMIFINGRKMNSTQLKKMNSNRLKIITNLKSIDNLCIIKHVKDDKIIANTFKSIHSDIDNAYDGLSDFEISELFKSNNSYNSTEANIKANKVDNDKILYHIIQDYYMRPYINDGDIFEYDFDEFNKGFEKDSDSNELITTMDASKEDKLGI